jgi:dephospho-CoA kinase
MKRPIIIGITGSIASGKSELVKILLELGYEVHSTDKLGHEALEEKTVITQLRDKFGPEILDERGHIDRDKLSRLVFKDKDKLAYLNSVSHPQIFSLMKQRIEDCQEKYIFFEVPLLFEAKLEAYFDYIVTVSASPEMQLDRLMKRNNISKDQALKKISSQYPNKQKEAQSDYVINNDGQLSLLKAKTQQWLEEFPLKPKKNIKRF